MEDIVWAYGAGKEIYEAAEEAVEATQRYMPPNKKPRTGAGPNDAQRIAIARAGAYTRSRQFVKLGRSSVSKLIDSSIQTTVLGFRGVGVQNDETTSSTACPGWFKLSNQYGVESTNLLPIMFMDLTSAANKGYLSNVAGESMIYGQPMYKVGVSSAAPAQVNFYVQNGQDYPGSGGPNNAWRILKRPDQAHGLGMHLSCNLGDRPMLDTSNIKLMLHGSRRAATQFVIQLIQFTEDFMGPNADAAINVEEEQEWGTISQMVKPFMYNELVGLNPSFKKYYKVLREQKCMLPSADTTNADDQPAYCVVNWFVKFGRLVNFKWRVNSRTAANQLPDLANAGFQLDAHVAPYGVGEYDQIQYVYAQPRARVYLVVKATNDTATAAGTEDYNNTPSFDLNVLNTWKTIGATQYAN